MSEQGLIDSRSEPGAGRRPGVGAAGALWLTALPLNELLCIRR